jgi:hypothetical protein
MTAWSLDAPLVTGPGHEWASSVGLQMVVGNVLVVGLHLWLMLPRYRRAPRGGRLRGVTAFDSRPFG